MTPPSHHLPLPPGPAFRTLSPQRKDPVTPDPDADPTTQREPTPVQPPGSGDAALLAQLRAAVGPPLARMRRAGYAARPLRRERPW